MRFVCGGDWDFGMGIVGRAVEGGIFGKWGGRRGGMLEAYNIPTFV